MKDIYFKGYYGFKNLGDDIFTVTADWICNNLWTDYKPIFIGECLPIVSDKAKSIETNNIFLRRLIELYICLKSSNIIYFGGSLFSGGITGPKDIKYYLNKFPIFHNKLGTIGTSIGPFKDIETKHQTKQLLQKFKYIAVRDYTSMELAKEMGLGDKANFGFDNAILLQDVYADIKHVSKANEKRRLAISLCHYERYNGGDRSRELKREDSLLHLLQNVVDSECNIEELVFIVFNGNEKTGDAEITKKFDMLLKTKIKTRVIDYSTDTHEILKEISKCDFMIGTRLHSGIVAYSLGIPFILVEYHAKCSEFLNTINHNYRFIEDDTGNNIKIFQQLYSEGRVPEIVEPEYFKNVMLENLKSIRELL